MHVRVALLLSLLALGPSSAWAQDAREDGDRALKGALGTGEIGSEEAGNAFAIVHHFLQGQARLCERREGPRNEEEIDWLVNELLATRLEEAGVASSARRSLVGVAHSRLDEIVDAARRRDGGEAGIKQSLSGSSLSEEELPFALADLIADAEAAGPSLLRRAEQLAAEENANALPGQEVEPDPIPVVVEHLSERFEGRGLSSKELEALAEPFTQLVEARREMLDAARFANGRGR